MKQKENTCRALGRAVTSLDLSHYNSFDSRLANRLESGRDSFKRMWVVATPGKRRRLLKRLVEKAWGHSSYTHVFRKQTIQGSLIGIRSGFSS